MIQNTFKLRDLVTPEQRVLLVKTIESNQRDLASKLFKRLFKVIRKYKLEVRKKRGRLYRVYYNTYWLEPKIRNDKMYLRDVAKKIKIGISEVERALYAKHCLKKQ